MSRSAADAQAIQDLMAIKVHGSDSTILKGVSWRHYIAALYHWTTWFFISGMVFSQFLCIVRNSTTMDAHLQYGSDPREGISAIVGSNDVPFTDRAVACVPGTVGYEPKLVSQALSTAVAMRDGSSNASSVGYRLISRDINSQLDVGVVEIFQHSCNLIANTISAIVSACSELGYEELARDVLRVTVDDGTYKIADALPILIIPFFDNSQSARHAIPATDGDACVFRLSGGYSDLIQTDLVFRGVNKSIRHDRTVSWLGRPGGVWRNGWYEDPTGERWTSDVVSTYSTSTFNMMYRHFDMRTGEEISGSRLSQYDTHQQTAYTWGSKFTLREKYAEIDSIYIGSASPTSHRGVFYFQTRRVRTVIALYDWETFLSNASITLLLIRWALSMMVLHRGYLRSETNWHTTGIGCISGSGSFNLLAFSVLPRLKTILCAFWTIGCNFEGQQRGISDAWFAMYPAIVEFVLLLFSLLDSMARVLRRRITDALFAPTIIALSLMHYHRSSLAETGWLSGVESRVSTVVFSEEVERMGLVDFITTDIAMRLNGNVRELYIIKLVVIGLNLLPIVLAKRLPGIRPQNRLGCGPTTVLKAMALRGENIGGLGLSSRNVFVLSGGWKTNRVGPSASIISSKHHADAFIESYELVRLGYIVYGGKYLLKFDDWDVISSLALFRSLFHLWNHRVVVWTLEDQEAKQPPVKGEHRTRTLKSLEPEILRLDDPKLLQVHWWDITAPDIE